VVVAFDPSISQSSVLDSVQSNSMLYSVQSDVVLVLKAEIRVYRTTVPPCVVVRTEN